MSVKENLTAIKKNIPSAVALIAVSKTKPDKAIVEAYNAGQRDFGENYVQELTDKEERLPKNIRWHFIGHLQTNKVKYIVPFVYLIHGVDSFKLLKEINKQAAKINRVVNCLLQIYIAQEETKFGFDFEECEALLKSGELKELKNVNVIGFMAMASNTSDSEQVKKEFTSLKQFQEKMLSVNSQFTILSFGMSTDYKLAIECGSNMVRIGSSIFGERNYTKF
ncbi:MAG: YggS family pyridoxal phosphate-dependent enzyme [Bacteroidia bacterium]